MAIGTDGYVMDMLTELKVAGILGKTAAGRGDRATATELMMSCTKRGAEALGRRDLGVIAQGALAGLFLPILTWHRG